MLNVDYNKQRRKISGIRTYASYTGIQFIEMQRSLEIAIARFYSDRNAKWPGTEAWMHFYQH